MPPNANGSLAELPARVDESLSNVVELRVHPEHDELLEQLMRRNEALEDFAALVAHELKTPLHEALLADDPSKPLEEALDLVDELLDAAQETPLAAPFTSVAECLYHATEDLSPQIEVTSDLTATMPISPGPLRVILRNLLANAAAAAGRHVHVTAARSARSWRLVVDDDGVGLAETDGYVAGSGLGLALCRRIAARFGSVLELSERPTGGTRATLEFAETS